MGTVLCGGGRYRVPVRGMQLCERYCVPHGLLVCSVLLHSVLALETARRQGEYIVSRDCVAGRKDVCEGSEFRALAERQLGSGFDVRKFCDVVLEGGRIPLETFEERVGRWLLGRKACSRAG